MAATTPKANDDFHELMLVDHPQLDKFPRDRRIFNAHAAILP